MKSEALDAGQGWLLSAARAVGLWRKPPLAALHELVVQSPDGRSRTFRCATSLGPRLFCEIPRNSKAQAALPCGNCCTGYGSCKFVYKSVLTLNYEAMCCSVCLVQLVGSRHYAHLELLIHAGGI